MAKAKKRHQRAAAAGPRASRRRQTYEVGYEAKKTGKARGTARKAVKKVGNSRRKIERALSRGR